HERGDPEGSSTTHGYLDGDSGKTHDRAGLAWPAADRESRVVDARGHGPTRVVVSGPCEVERAGGERPARDRPHAAPVEREDGELQLARMGQRERERRIPSGGVG